MSDIDPAAIMAEHHSVGDGSAGDDNSCAGDNYDCGYMWPCPTYRLAEALIAEQAKVRYYKAAMITARREAEGPASSLQPMQPGQSSTCWALPHEGPCHYSHLLGDD